MKVFNSALFVVSALAWGSLESDAFQPLHPARSPPSTALFGKKKKGGGGKARGQQQQEKQSVQDARFDAATRQFMFTLVGLTKILPDKSKKILDNIHLSFYPGAKIGIVGLNGSGKVCRKICDRVLCH